MRNAFADEVTSLAEGNPKIMLLSGDIGNRLFDRLREQNPMQFLNCGVAEANMIGVAAGMAMSGLKPITYTITPFTTTRCLEQIRIDIAYHEASVIIVGTGAGLSYAGLGPTHHSLEDFAIFRPIPNIRILAPWDAPSLRAMLRAALLDSVPTYIRIGKKGEPELTPIESVAPIGRLTKVVDGGDVVIVAVGTVASEAVNSAAELHEQNISASVTLAHTVKPLPESDLLALFDSYKRICIVEEHSCSGGFGESCVNFAYQSRFSGEIKLLGVPDIFLSGAGSQQFARKVAGIDSSAITRAVRDLLRVDQ